ncbi:cyclin-dependent kinase inhibitor 3 family protein [Aestuariivirga sp.]|uniref:cyclin-dependent kinase inhibitor 3 family protein n=1 Tax=Aestuariivirga sp. TaxID=2650926 RepID=UPI003593BCA0
MTARTSLTHPLQIAEVTAPDAKGAIGITFCPGKVQPAAMSGAWHRDLGLDLDAIRKWGASTVITLIEHHEMKELRVQAIGADVAARGMDWLHMPITDVSVPDQRFTAAWKAEGQRLIAAIREGARVLVHCKGGLGRAGTVAALMLVDLGMDPQQAIQVVRKARPGAIETKAQEHYILNHGAMSGA